MNKTAVSIDLYVQDKKGNCRLSKSNVYHTDEAVEKMAKALCGRSFGPCYKCRYKRNPSGCDSCLTGGDFYGLARAALLTLLGGKK